MIGAGPALPFDVVEPANPPGLPAGPGSWARHAVRYDGLSRTGV